MTIRSAIRCNLARRIQKRRKEKSAKTYYVAASMIDNRDISFRDSIYRGISGEPWIIYETYVKEKIVGITRCITRDNKYANFSGEFRTAVVEQIGHKILKRAMQFLSKRRHDGGEEITRRKSVRPRVSSEDDNRPYFHG